MVQVNGTDLFNGLHANEVQTHELTRKVDNLGERFVRIEDAIKAIANDISFIKGNLCIFK